MFSLLQGFVFSSSRVCFLFFKGLFSLLQGFVFSSSRVCFLFFKGLFSLLQGSVFSSSRVCFLFFKGLFSLLQGSVFSSSRACFLFFKGLFSLLQGFVFSSSRVCFLFFKGLFSLLQGFVFSSSRVCFLFFKGLFSLLQGFVFSSSRVCFLFFKGLFSLLQRFVFSSSRVCFLFFWTRPIDRRCMSVRTRTHHEEMLTNWIRETAQLSQERSVASKVLLKSIATPDKTTWEQLLNHVRRTPSTTRIDISNHPKISCKCQKTQLTPQPSVADTRRQDDRGNILFTRSASNCRGRGPSQQPPDQNSIEICTTTPRGTTCLNNWMTTFPQRERHFLSRDW